MKKIGIIVFGAAIIIGIVFSSLFSFGRLTSKVFNVSFNSGVEGSGNSTTETRGVSDFTSIEVGGVFQVEIVAQKDFSLQVEADDNLLEYIKTEVRDGRLMIETDKNFNTKTTIRVRITAPNIERIEASGASKVSITDLKNSSLHIDSNGASKISVTGETARLKVEVSGAGNIDAQNLKAENGDIDASGASHADVDVAGTLRAEASGASRITYAGSPKTLNKASSGASSINQK